MFLQAYNRTFDNESDHHSFLLDMAQPNISLLSKMTEKEHARVKPKSVECNRICSQIRSSLGRTDPKDDHFVCALLFNLHSKFESILNQKNSKIRKLEKSLKYFETNFIKAKHKLNILSKNLFKIQKFREKEPRLKHPTHSSEIHCDYFIKMLPNSHKKKVKMSKSRTADHSQQFIQSGFIKQGAKTVSESGFVRKSLLKHKADVFAKSKPAQNAKLRRVRRKNVKSIDVGKEARFGVQASGQTCDWKDHSKAAKKSNLVRDSVKMKMKIKDNIVFRKKLFGSKSHRIGRSPRKNQQLKPRKARNGGRVKKVALKAGLRVAPGKARSQKPSREKGSRQTTKNPKEAKAKRFISHQQNLSVKISQLNLVKNSKVHSKPSLNQISPQNLTSELKTNSIFFYKQKSQKQSASSKKNNLGTISHFNSENKKAKIGSKKRKEAKSRGFKSNAKRKFLRRTDKKQPKLLRVLELDLEENVAKRRLGESGKNPNSLKNIASTLSQVQLNYIFSQKKSLNLSSKFDFKHAHTNKTPNNQLSRGFRD